VNVNNNSDIYFTIYKGIGNYVMDTN